MAHVYVTGHRNPDLDSIASAIGYAELMGRLDPHDTYIPVRLGDVNPQTAWVLERSGAPSRSSSPTSCCACRDVMRELFVVANRAEPVREVGLRWPSTDLDLMPVVDEEGKLAGMVTERDARAPLHPRVARASTLADAPATRGHDRRRPAGRAGHRRARP